MIKCEVIENFSLKDFKKLKNLVRKNADVDGKLYVGDIFECDKEMAEYLTGKNALSKEVVKIIEVQPKIEIIINNDELIKEMDEIIENELKSDKGKTENHIIEDATIEYTDEEVKPKATIKKKKTSEKKVEE